MLKRIKVVLYMIVGVFLWNYYIFQSFASAEESLEESIDCTDVRIDYSDDKNLTREERLRRMNEAFYESLNRFELCQEAKEKAKTAAGASGGGAAGNGGGGALIGFEPACGVCGRNAELTPLLLLLLVGFTGCGPRANGIAFDPCPTGGGGGTAAGGGGGGGRLP